MIAIIDYGAGNLGSVHKAFKFIGSAVEVTESADAVARADALVLPGVGAFTHCMTGLQNVGLTDATKQFIRSGRPFLGICVGLQMLFDESEEMGRSPGLGVLSGKVVRFPAGLTMDNRRWTEEESCTPTDLNTEYPIPDTRYPTPDTHLKVPHIGWNELRFREGAALFRGLTQGDRVYFVHSYYPEPEDRSIISAVTDYGGTICSAVETGNVHATQFHPEKSGTVGLEILRNFAALAS